MRMLQKAKHLAFNKALYEWSSCIMVALALGINFHHGWRMDTAIWLSNATR
jgi:hypothetical protein